MSIIFLRVTVLIGTALMLCCRCTYLVSSFNFCHHTIQRSRAAHNTQLQSSKAPSISSRGSIGGSKGKSKSKEMRSRRKHQKHYFIAPSYHINQTTSPLNNDMTLFDIDDNDDNDDNNNNNSPVMKSYVQARSSPFPTMPSEIFTNLAQSQFELLSNSLVHIITTSQQGGGGTMTRRRRSGGM